MAATRIGKSGAPMGVQRRATEVVLPGMANNVSAIAAAPARQAVVAVNQ